jgi:hypothetical protein
MKCKWCDNRIWVEPVMSTPEVNIFAKKQSIETGISLSADDAEKFANAILREVRVIREM